jgi:hypothetical protein
VREEKIVDVVEVVECAVARIVASAVRQIHVVQVGVQFAVVTYVAVTFMLGHPSSEHYSLLAVPFHHHQH